MGLLGVHNKVLETPCNPEGQVVSSKIDTILSISNSISIKKKKDSQMTKITGGLSIVHWNIQSFSHAKYVEFKKFHWFQNENNKNALPSIICLTESWFSSEIADDLFKIEGYKIERRDRNTRGGGLLVYLKDDTTYQFKRIKELECVDLEVMCFKIQAVKSKPFLLFFIYRKPNSLFLNSFKTMIKKGLNVSNEILILGDLNENLLQTPLSKASKDLSRFMENYGFTQLVTQPTRVTSLSCTLIDHAYANFSENIIACSVLKSSISDHYPVQINRKINGCVSVNENSVTFRQKTKDYEIKIANDIQQTNFCNVYSSNSATAAANALEIELQTTINRHMPIKTKSFSATSKRGNLCDVNVPLRKQRDRMKLLIHQHPNNQHYVDLYRQLRNRCVSETRLKIKQKVSKQIQTAANTNNQSVKFQCLNSLTNKSVHNSVSKLAHNNEMLHEPKTIADTLNNSFTSISEHYKHLFTDQSFDKNIITNFVQQKLDPTSTFSIPLPTRQEICSYLKELKSSVSTGLDDISAHVIKASMHALVEPLFHILSKSFADSEFPDGWKIARVTPIPKDKFSQCPAWENLRPVSVLNIVSKIGEKHVNKHVTRFFEVHGLFHSLQSGSRKFHSCETALLHLVDACYKNLSENKKSGLLFTDFSKAFDLINHEILLEKLKLYRFDQKAINWFRSYLSNRRQRVKINNIFSDSCNINTGVPQGSILGPLLFLIFTNDLPLSVVAGIVTSCVDDATVICSADSEHDLVHDIDLTCNNISNWCQPNQQVLNPTKMAVMSITGSRSLPPILNITLNGNIVDQVACKKLLGVTLDERMTFQDQVSTVKQQVLWKLHILRKLVPYCNQDLRLLYYQSFIFPHFIYCASVWALKNKESMVMLLQLQKQIVRTITGSDYLAPTLPLFLQLKIIPIVLQFKIIKIMLVYKSMNQQTPAYLADKFAIKVSDVSQRATRSVSDNKLFLPHHNKAYSKSFEITGIKLWNNLPNEIRNSPSLFSLKNKLKCYILEKMASLSEITDIWCKTCSVDHQFETLFCSHIAN